MSTPQTTNISASTNADAGKLETRRKSYARAAAAKLPVIVPSLPVVDEARSLPSRDGDRSSTSQPVVAEGKEKAQASSRAGTEVLTDEEGYMTPRRSSKVFNVVEKTFGSDLPDDNRLDDFP